MIEIGFKFSVDRFNYSVWLMTAYSCGKLNLYIGQNSVDVPPFALHI
jgi:hypothetical protein